MYRTYFKRPDFHLLTVPAGERSKSRRSKELLENNLLALGANRDSLIVALGGGMVGDLAGFVAATLLRGIPYIQIPTTLLAQVDSSIGGKVAIDHPLGKNLIGAFYQPQKVYIDIGALKTLPDREFSNGLAEVIKYAAILDSELFDELEQKQSKILSRDEKSLLNIIKRCCELKKSVVEEDEKETDYRRILNFGHTIGHAIERLSKYRIPHGQAVAIGMVAESTMSSHLGILPARHAERITSLLKMYNLPTEIPSTIKLEAIMRATLQDKKVHRGMTHYTLLERIGRARVGVRLSLKQARLLVQS
ncbi:MAG: 3-dehydroquinate synthase [Ignavibacteriales bacterium]|nr:3-dehydroquinate synthase [Ignavibacteriales bacterium]